MLISSIHNWSQLLAAAPCRGFLKGSSQGLPLKCCRWAGAVVELLLGKHVLLQAGEGSCRAAGQPGNSSCPAGEAEERWERRKEEAVWEGAGCWLWWALGELPLLHLTLLRGKWLELVQSG